MGAEIDDSWSLMNKIVNENGLESQIPDLPPDDHDVEPKDILMEDMSKELKVKMIVADIISECDDMKEDTVQNDDAEEKVDASMEALQKMKIDGDDDEKEEEETKETEKETEEVNEEKEKVETE